MKLKTDVVKKLMEDKGLTPDDLAKLMNVHRQTVYDHLWGNTGKTFRLISRLAKALHVSERELIE